MDEYERVRQDIAEIRTQLNRQDINVAVVREKVDGLEHDVDKMAAQFVTTSSFAPVRSLVYGMVGLIVIAFLSALIGLVVIPQP